MYLLENLSKLIGKFIDISKINTNQITKYAEQVRLGLHSNTTEEVVSGRQTFGEKPKEDSEKLKQDIKPPEAAKEAKPPQEAPDKK